MPWRSVGLMFHDEKCNEPNRARQNQRSRSGGAKTRVPDDFILADRLSGFTRGEDRVVLASRRIEAIEFGASAVILEARALEDAKCAAQFSADITAKIGRASGRERV